MAVPALENLLRVLAERDLDLGRDDVAWAFEDAHTRKTVNTWMNEYLSNSTLLTSDELDFHEKRGSPSHDIRSNVGSQITDSDLETAIETLETSTAALLNQTQVLEAQKRALLSISSRVSPGNTAAVTKAVRQKRLAREKAQLDFEIEKLEQNLRQRLDASSRKADDTAAVFPSQSERLFEKDDRLLDGLRKLLPKISNSESLTVEPISSSKLCAALIGLVTKEIRSRLDAKFRESVIDYLQHTGGSADQDLNEHERKQRDIIRAELSELGGEVEGLVPIVVDHQYRGPISRSLQSAQTDSHAQRAKWVEYIITALLYLTSRLQALDQHVVEMHGHRAALRAVSSTLEDTVSAQQAGSSNPRNFATPEKAGRRGLKPLRLVQANLSETTDPALHLLRLLDVSGSSVNDMTKLVTHLDSALNERDGKMLRFHKVTEASITDSVVQSVRMIDEDLEALIDAIYSRSKFTGLGLVEADVQACFTDVESSTQKLGDEMRDLHLEALAANIRQRQFAHLYAS